MALRRGRNTVAILAKNPAHDPSMNLQGETPMGQRYIAVASILSVFLVTGAIMPSAAQSQPTQRPASPQRSQPLPPPLPQGVAPKPYKAVTVSAPAPVSDPSFAAFRKQLADIVQKKDRKALAALVANNFFWMGEKGDKAVKGRPGIENLAKAISLDARDGSGWDVLDGFAADPTGSPFSERPNTICAPAEPQFNAQEFDQLTQSTSTDDSDWAYPTQPGLEMRASAQPNAPVTEKLGMHFILVMEDSAAAANQDSPMLRVVAPSGKVGFIPFDAVSPLVNDQLCYVKQAGAWKIAGFLGGEE
jgi:hypothetical protein